MLEKELMCDIERLRKKMIEKSEFYGIDSSQVLEISREIDMLHNKLNRLQKEKEVINSERIVYLKTAKKDDEIKETLFNFYIPSTMPV